MIYQHLLTNVLIMCDWYEGYEISQKYARINNQGKKIKNDKHGWNQICNELAAKAINIELDSGKTPDAKKTALLAAINDTKQKISGHRLGKSEASTLRPNGSRFVRHCENLLLLNDGKAKKYHDDFPLEYVNADKIEINNETIDSKIYLDLHILSRVRRLYANHDIRFPAIGFLTSNQQIQIFYNIVSELDKYLKDPSLITRIISKLNSKHNVTNSNVIDLILHVINKKIKQAKYFSGELAFGLGGVHKSVVEYLQQTAGKEPRIDNLVGVAHRQSAATSRSSKSGDSEKDQSAETNSALSYQQLHFNVILTCDWYEGYRISDEPAGEPSSNNTKHGWSKIADNLAKQAIEINRSNKKEEEKLAALKTEIEKAIKEIQRPYSIAGKHSRFANQLTKLDNLVNIFGKLHAHSQEVNKKGDGVKRLPIKIIGSDQVNINNKEENIKFYTDLHILARVKRFYTEQESKIATVGHFTAPQTKRVVLNIVCDLQQYIDEPSLIGPKLTKLGETNKRKDITKLINHIIAKRIQQAERDANGFQEQHLGRYHTACKEYLKHIHSTEEAPTETTKVTRGKAPA